MPDMWMDVDTALAEVPVNIAPLIDDTDFKTIEDAIAYNAAGMDLRWNFVTCAGAYTSTAVTPTTGGAYDWAHQGDGMYSIEIPASGGASINNDTEGFGWFSGKITGVLPFRGPVIGFRRAALNDLLVDGGTASTNLEDFFDGTGYAGGTTKLDVNTASVTNGAITAAAIATDAIDADSIKADAVTKIQNGLATPTNITAGTITTVTNLTNAPTNGDLTATMKASVNTEVVDALNVDTYAEPGQGAPTATTTLAAKINYLYKFMRNKITTTADNINVYNDAGDTIDQKSTHSDDGTTYTRGEFGTGA